MATAKNSPAAGKAAQADGLTQVTLIRGSFTDREDDQDVTYGAGSTVTVCAEDLAMLKRLGFVRDDDATKPEVVQDGTLVSLHTEAGQGPTITPTA